MIQNFNESLASVLTISTLLMGGVLGLVGLFERGRRDQVKAKDEQTTGLITIMEKRIDALTTDVQKARQESKDALIGYERLKAENDVLVKVLQGRNAEMVEFIKNGEAGRKVTEDNNKMLKTLTKEITELAKVLKTHYHKTDSN